MAVHVLHADEERDQVAVALERADGGVERAGHAGLDEGVAGVGALGRVRPPEQLAEERAVPSGSLERISAWTMGWFMVTSGW